MTERKQRSNSPTKETESRKILSLPSPGADDGTLNKILSTTPGRPQPEFQGDEYIAEIKHEVLKCNEPNCTGAFTTEASLYTHKLKHLKRNLKCEFCNMLFENEEDRTKHLNEFHPDLENTPEANPLQCKKCGKIPRDKMALRRHVQESHKGSLISCPHCGVLFSRPHNMKAHIKYTHPPEGVPLKVYSCEICEQQFRHKSGLRCHIRSAHREKITLCCVICDTTYSTKDSYRNHMRRHVKPTFLHYSCTICNKKFPDFTKLNRHLQTYSHKIKEKQQQQIKMETLSEDEEPQVDYTETEMKFDTGATHFTKEELIESCKKKVIKIILHRVDEKKVSYNFSYRTPKRTVDTKHLSCVYCSKSLPNLEAVKPHEAICFKKIRSTKLHICPHANCNKKFPKVSKLKLHMSTHSNERPFPCSYCDSKFKLQSLKIQHERGVHFGIRPNRKPKIFTCNYEGCGKKFRANESLRVHVGVDHIGVNHPCKVCGKIFRRKASLKRHAKQCQSERSSDNKTLLCHPCKRTYKSRRFMLLHFATERHKQKAEELCRMFGNKEEMTEVLSGKHRLLSATGNND